MGCREGWCSLEHAKRKLGTGELPGGVPWGQPRHPDLHNLGPLFTAGTLHHSSLYFQPLLWFCSCFCSYFRSAQTMGGPWKEAPRSNTLAAPQIREAPQQLHCSMPVCFPPTFWLLFPHQRKSPQWFSEAADGSVLPMLFHAHTASGRLHVQFLPLEILR